MLKPYRIFQPVFRLRARGGDIAIDKKDFSANVASLV